MTCPVCGTITVPGARFCHNCGTRLPSAEILPATERRTVTVLFGDLSDFTAWSEDLDPERVGAVTDRVLAALAGAVKTFGGHVDKLTGDGIMAVFGAPVAHEDDTERAVRAALAMQRAVRRVLDDEQGGGVPMGLRLGLNTGEVVAGVQAGVEYTVIGDTVNTAARLADAAAIGTAYAGERTATDSRRIAAWRQLRPLKLKGKREPVEAYELLGQLDTPMERDRLGFGDEAPFLGRETDLGRVTNRLAEVIDRAEPRFLVVTAEAGLGKSRFAAEAARKAEKRGARTLSVRCVAYGERRRLAPLADLVRVALGLSPDDGAAHTAVTRGVIEERLRRLSDRLSRIGQPKVQTDLLLALLGFGELPHPHAERLATQTAEEEAVPAAVAALLSGLAAETPLMVEVDDAQDATPQSLDALGAMLSRLTGPVLVLLLGRPELVRTAGVLNRISDAEVHALSPLRGSDASRLLSAYLGGGRIGQADEDKLLMTAQGNAFYLAELITLLKERGLLTDGGGGGQWSLKPGSLAGGLLSRDLAAVLAARIDALPPEARSVLRDAAVVGDSVPLGALEMLQGGQIDQYGEELLTRRMLRRQRFGYHFATPLMRQAAYSGVGLADRAEKHGKLARWALSMTPGTDADLFVAEHAEQAVHYGEAMALREDDDQISVIGLGVAALGRLARRAVSGGDPTQAAKYAERAAQLAGGELSTSDQVTYARALLQLARPHDALAHVTPVLADPDPLVRVQAQLLAGRAHRVLGDPDQATALWTAALAGAEEAAIPTQRAEALLRLGMADYLAGRLTEAAGRFEAAHRVSVDAGDRRNQAWALQHLGWVTTTRGDFEAADTVLNKAARLFAELDDPIGRAWIRGTTAFARLLEGKLAEARRLATAFLPFGERVGEHWAVGTLRSVEAFAAAELGELAEADREARRAYRDFATTDDDWGRALALIVRGVVARGFAEQAHAIDLLNDAEGYATRAGHPLLIGMARTIRGYVRLEQGDAGSAEKEAIGTLEIVSSYEAQDAARVGPLVLLAEARRAQGDSARALELLEEVTACPACPSLLLPRTQAVAYYSQALLESGQAEEAVYQARLAVEAPAEELRTRIVAHRALASALAATGDLAGAREAAAAAVGLAYSTQQLAERAACDELMARLAG
ncbi:AAA family ATPase [Longispora albida]|uniref:AAA family ATPase n=1 Tax=Longispora albida TaxID=203523 RepID=UPI00037E7D52|nr:adenylate/guanylate cyclase domain-containing protein [Longispora albida]